MKKQLLLAIFTIFVGIGISEAQQLFTNYNVNTNITSNVFVNIQGGLLNDAAGTGTIQNNGSIIMTGNFVNNNIFQSGANSYVKLTGAAQDIGGSNSTTFNNLIIDGTANKTISLLTNVADSLKFIANYVLIANNNLVLLQNGSISGSANTRYVVTNGTGSLVKKSVPLSTDFLFPVGSAVANYKPVTINNAGTVDTFAVRIVAGVTPTTGADAECVQYTYFVEESNSGGSNASLKLGWNTADEGGSFVRANAYEWQNTSGNWNYLPGTAGFTPDVPTNYYHITTGITDFSSTANKFILRSFQLLSITDQPDPVSFCANNNTSFSVTATGSNLNYQWQVNCGGGWSNVTNTGIYGGATTSTLSLTGFDYLYNGCQYQCMVYNMIDTIYSNPAILTVFPNAVANAGSDTTIVIGQTVQLDGSGAGVGGSYFWTPSVGLTDPTSANPFAGPTSTTTYVLQVIDANGCSDFDTVTVYVNDNCGDVFVPNAFSPNDDGKNDIVYVRGNCLKEMNFVIYDRWGEKVFETTDLSTGWDGKLDGKVMNPAVFVYYLTGTLFNGDAVKMQGNITLFK